MPSILCCSFQGVAGFDFVQLIATCKHRKRSRDDLSTCHESKPRRFRLGRHIVDTHGSIAVAGNEAAAVASEVQTLGAVAIG